MCSGLESKLEEYKRLGQHYTFSTMGPLRLLLQGSRAWCVCAPRRQIIKQRKNGIFFVLKNVFTS